NRLERRSVDGGAPGRTIRGRPRRRGAAAPARSPPSSADPEEPVIRHGGRAAVPPYAPASALGALTTLVVGPHAGGIPGQLHVVDGEGEIAGDLLDHFGRADPASGPLAVVGDGDGRRIGRESLGLDVELHPGPRLGELDERLDVGVRRLAVEFRYALTAPPPSESIAIPPPPSHAPCIHRANDSWRILTDPRRRQARSEEHTSELQSRENLVC